jgi:hypothetical protein
MTSRAQAPLPPGRRSRGRPGLQAEDFTSGRPDGFRFPGRVAGQQVEHLVGRQRCVGVCARLDGIAFSDGADGVVTTFDSVVVQSVP